MQDLPVPDFVAIDTPVSPPELELQSESESQTGSETHPFSFTGTTRGYFGIWIVNLFLTIITLGIYSAWAKVRKKRYFYGHTYVAGANFEYHGNPIAILKGRVIALVLFGGYSAINYFTPLLAQYLAFVLFAAAPWFISRSMAFNAYNSSYRNIRFCFRASYREVFATIWPLMVFLVLAFLVPEIDPKSKAPPPASFWVVQAMYLIVIASIYPFVLGSIKKLHVNHSQFGTSPFQTDVQIRAFFKIYAKALGLGLLSIAFLGVIAALAMPLWAMIRTGAIGGWAFLVVPVIVIAYVLGMALLLAYTKSRIGNLMFNESRLNSRVSFSSTQQVWKLTRIYVVNIFAILLSFGLAVPWAVIRTMRYRAECLTLQCSSSLDDFVGGVQAQVGATGEEFGEFLNIDLSL